MSHLNLGGAASERVWGMVSGLPSRHRLGRRLLMLQVWMDESAKGDFFVMAGYIASVPKWAQFSDEWDALLNNRSNHFPRLDEFHMTEMTASDERREMVPWFYRVIERHVEGALSCSINVTELQQEFERYPWPDYVVHRDRIRNPYGYAFKQMFFMLKNFKEHIGIDADEKIDFIFDERLQDEAACRRASKRMCEQDASFLALCGETPQFRKSHLNMPLQAADLFAYWVREWREKGVQPKTGYLPFGWRKSERDIYTLMVELSGGDFVKSWGRNLIVEGLRATGHANPEAMLPEKKPTLRVL